MSQYLTVIVIGVYTIVNVIVFFIQKSQIQRQKDILSSMKTFIDIFKVDEVKKYVELKEERLIMSLKKTMDDSEYLKEITENIVNDKSNEIKLALAEEVGEKYIELTSVVMKVVMNQKPEHRQNFIKEITPLNQDFLLGLLRDIEKK